MRKIPSLAVILVLISSNVFAATTFVSDVEPFLTPERHEALVWMKGHTADDGVVLTWWHYTGMVNTIADRRTILSTTPTPATIEDPATFFSTSNETKAIEIVKDEKADYIMVDKQMYQLWSVILTHSKDENKNIMQSMLYKLYNNEDLEFFKLIFDNEGVKVYEPLYNYTHISIFEPNKYLYQPGDEVRLTVKISSNELGETKLRIATNLPNIPTDEIYDLKVNSTLQKSFKIPLNATHGRYSLNAYLYDPQMKNLDAYYRQFIVI